MDSKGIATGLVFVAALVASSLLGATASNSNPLTKEFSNSKMLTVPDSAPAAQSVPVPEPKKNTIGADTVGFYGASLLSNPDPNSRIQLIRALSLGAAKPTKDVHVGLREPQAVEILGAALRQEQDPRVRVEIVNALSEFNVPEAAELLNRASSDDRVPAVREAAQQAKARRQVRLLFATCCE